MKKPSLDPNDEAFNWLTALQYLADGGEALEWDLNYLEVGAGHWPTCACGQLCKALPRRQGGGPLDRTLFLRGVGFSSAVGSGRWSRALELFQQIEQRTEELLYEQRNSKTN